MLFEEIPGQEVVKEKLLSLYNQQRLPNTLMLSGGEGCCSLALAVAFAQYIMCVGQKGNDACNQCDNCSKTSSFIHPDLHFSFPVINSEGAKTSDAFITEWRNEFAQNPFLSYKQWIEAIKDKDEQNKQGNITAEECRAIIRKLSLKSYEGGKKIMIIWLPEFMGNSSNILLKVLEEPPENTHFIFVTEEINKILSTVISRSQIINVPPLSFDELKDFLIEKYELSTTDATNISYISKGNICTAIEMTDETDTTYTENIRNWFLYCYSRNNKNIFEWINSTSAMGREKIKKLLENCNYILNECLHCIHIVDYKPKVPSANEKFVIDLSKILNSEKIQKIYTEINQTIYHIERNSNARISLTNLSFLVRNIFHNKTFN
ncbi:MAG: hypothetical protein HUU47_06220 [Bacteroidetes bacterium]|nr:hypothetical protein [Bacteroidota bacterium]